MLQKPATCAPCPLYKSGHGFAYPVGPTNAPIAVIGEALGKTEALYGKPFIGPSGAFLEKVLRLVGIDRESLRIHNVVSCQPPKDWLDGAPWEHGAIATCHQYLAKVLAENHKVVVTLGSIASRTLLGVPKGLFKAENWHATINEREDLRFPVIPTFHPAYLLRGNQKLTSAVLFAFQQAKKIAAQGTWARSPASLIVDPSPAFFEGWVSRLTETAWLAVDIETNEKLATSEDQAIEGTTITRINFSYNPGEGITVPWSGQYLVGIRKLLRAPGVKCFWNCPTPDQKVLSADLTWVEAGSLKVGDKLVAFDEEVPSGKRARHYQEATVTHAGRARETVYAITLSNGQTIKVTANHPWLIKPPVGKKRRVRQWVKTSELQPGWKLHPLFNVWETGTSREHGYLAGFFDGEGCYTLQGATRTCNVSASQKIGPTLDYVTSLVSAFPSKFKMNQYSVLRAKDSHIKQLRVAGRTADVARFLGEVRPERLRAKFKVEHLGSLQSRKDQHVLIDSIECLGEQEIVTLSTSTKTYVLEGFGAHNSNYDVPRLNAAGCPVLGTPLDFMWAWHVLQSDLPKGLGFVAPFYSDYGAWKHLASTGEAAKYAAIDALQTIRCAFGIAADLRAAGQWETFIHHVYELDSEVLQPATKVGLAVDKGRLEEFSVSLDHQREVLRAQLESLYPPELLPLSPKGGWKKKPVRNDAAFSKEVEELVKFCTVCDEKEVKKGHKCKKGVGAMVIEEDWMPVIRWFVTEPFNPNSNDQIASYIAHKGLSNRHTESGKLSTGALVLDQLAAKDEFFKILLEFRGIEKIRTTYVESTKEKIKFDGRLHATFLHNPSTMRLSCVNPNLTNVAHAA